MVDGERSFTTTWRKPEATLQDVVRWMGRAQASAAAETFLPGFRPVIGNDAESDNGGRGASSTCRNYLEVTLRTKNSAD